MKAIRRSLKSDKDQKQPPHIQPKSALAFPPKLVIKALYDYSPANPNGQELPFSKGDFFHVLSREADEEWYEACNPISGQRGLVPVAYFENVDKQQRTSAGESIRLSGEKQVQHDSGFSENGTLPVHGRSESQATAKAPSHNRGMSSSTRPGAMVYGVVMYDFAAERADELEAKAGEAIIVVAQSNPEWFVAKPIGRLGGPGLIPVSFVDIKDTHTMQSVTDSLDAVRRAGVPRVEEWKKFAADYKNSSISLGKLEVGGPQSAVDGIARMSLQNSASQSSLPSSAQSMGRSSQVPQLQLLAPIHASVPRYCFDNDTYWYIIECQMEDGRWWELSRYYADFYDFQIALIEAFPEEAGNKGKPRSLPFMPGPVAHVTDAISNGRRKNLDDYIKQIVAMPPHISKSQLVRNLFKPRPNQDFEIDPNALNEDFRLSAGSQQSMPQMSRQSTNQASTPGGYGGMPPPQGRPTHQRGMSSAVAPPLHTQASNLTQNSQSSGRLNNPGGALKIKVFFQDDIIAIRVPQEISFGALKEKLIERLKVNEDIIVQYKDDMMSPTSGQNGPWIDLRDDDGLEEALMRNPKLTLRCDYASG